MRPILVGFVVMLTLVVDLALGRFVIPRDTEPQAVSAECGCAVPVLPEGSMCEGKVARGCSRQARSTGDCAE